MRVDLFTDGGARGNPGPAGLGIVIKDETGKNIRELGLYAGKATNNDAEYLALIKGMEECAVVGATEISCTLDSELVVKQLNGAYKVKNERMKKYHAEVKKLESGFVKVTYKHVKREKNKEADALVNKVLDSIKNA